MKLESLQSGMTVYSVGRQKMGNTTMSTVAAWAVKIVEVDAERGIVRACWHGNASRCFYRREVEKWRAKKPVLVKSGFGHRLATRAEIKAMKEKPE